MVTIKKGLDQVLKWASVFLFTALVIIVSWQVISRSLGDASTWAEEAARYSFVWLGFFAAALVFSEKGHIAVDFIVRRQKLSVQKVTAILAQLSIIALAILVFIWGGIRASGRAWTQQLSSLPGTVGMMYLVLPVTGVLITFYAVFHMLQIIRDEEPPYAPDEAESIVPAVVDEPVDGDVVDATEAQIPTKGQENL